MEIGVYSHSLELRGLEKEDRRWEDREAVLERQVQVDASSPGPGCAGRLQCRPQEGAVGVG